MAKRTTTKRAKTTPAKTRIESDSMGEMHVQADLLHGATTQHPTRHPTRRIEFTVAIDYGDDLDRAIAVGTAALARDPHVHAAPAPLVAVSCLAPTSVELVLRAYVAQGDYLAARYALQRAVKTDLQAAGIHLPPSPRPPRA